MPRRRSRVALASILITAVFLFYSVVWPFHAASFHGTTSRQESYSLIWKHIHASTSRGGGESCPNSSAYFLPFNTIDEHKKKKKNQVLQHVLPHKKITSCADLLMVYKLDSLVHSTRMATRCLYTTIFQYNASRQGSSRIRQHSATQTFIPQYHPVDHTPNVEKHANRPVPRWSSRGYRELAALCRSPRASEYGLFHVE
jgi:hypothetical protein